MQTYQPYYPQMNNGYMPQYNPQQPYIDRLAGLQQYQQNLQGAQMSLPNQQVPQGINGRIVANAESIAANDVPMDGSVAFFPIQDMSQILAKSWNADGTIKTLIYKPFAPEPNNLPSETGKIEIGLSESATAAFMQRFDDVTSRIDKLEQSLTKSLTKKGNSLTKKEVEAE